MTTKGYTPYNKGVKGVYWRSTKNDAVHYYVRLNLPKPDKCPNCHRVIRLELCNISKKYNPETYNRDLKNWYYNCRKCHIISDGRLEKTLQRLSNLSPESKKRQKRGLKYRFPKGHIPWNKGTVGLQPKPSADTTEKRIKSLKATCRNKIESRRAKVLELLNKGVSRWRICKELKCSSDTIYRDCKYLTVSLNNSRTVNK